MMEIGEVRKIVEAALMVAGEALSVEQLELLFVEGDLDSEEIEALLQKRVAARQERDFETSDKIRDDLARQGVILEDGPNGTSWRRG